MSAPRDRYGRVLDSLYWSATREASGDAAVRYRGRVVALHGGWGPPYSPMICARQDIAARLALAHEYEGGCY